MPRQDEFDPIDFFQLTDHEEPKKKRIVKAVKKPDQQVSAALLRLTAKQERGFNIDKLNREVLRPLIDLAYWSNFVEVRRDAAAALATLAMNGKYFMHALHLKLSEVVTNRIQYSNPLRSGCPRSRDSTYRSAQQNNRQHYSS